MTTSLFPSFHNRELELGLSSSPVLRHAPKVGFTRASTYRLEKMAENGIPGPDVYNIRDGIKITRVGSTAPTCGIKWKVSNASLQGPS